MDKPKDAHLINTEWVIVEKEDEKGGKIIKARLCMRGDLEKNKHLIPTDSPTINRTTLRLMLAIANSKKWDIECSDITRAFLQTEDLSRDIFVQPPLEVSLKKGKVWRLKRSGYGLIDASR